MIITKEERAKLTPHLPDDYQKQGNEATGFSRSMIYKVLWEGQDNDIIHDWLYKTAVDNKKAKDRAEKKRARMQKQL